MRRSLVVLLTSLAVAACGGDAEPDAGVTAKGKGVRLVKVGNFAAPVYVTSPPGDRKRIYVVEQDGRVIVKAKGRKRTFLDIRDQVTGGGEQGLLSLAFAPDYRKSKLFYVYYTDNGGDQRVAEFRARSANRADESSERLVLLMEDSESNHNGGLLLFGPDKRLYIGTGDGGGGGDQHGRFGNGQNLQTLLGKLLRIDPRPGNAGAYGIPSDNPFAGAKGPRNEIYSYGLRNPWRFSFTRSGGLAIGDVGQSEQEEISYVERGDGASANFGWRVFEGDARYADDEEAPGHVPPVHTLSHDDGNCSITGGVEVRDKRVRGLLGRYVFGDFCKGRILSGKLATPSMKGVRDTGLRVGSLSSFGVDGRRRAYAVSLNGPVFRIAAKK